MRKSLLIMFLLFAAGITANAQKFALIDMEYILKNIPAYQSASKRQRKKKRLLPKRNPQPNCAANTSVRKANFSKSVKR